MHHRWTLVALAAVAGCGDNSPTTTDDDLTDDVVAVDSALPDATPAVPDAVAAGPVTVTVLDTFRQPVTDAEVLFYDAALAPLARVAVDADGEAVAQGLPGTTAVVIRPAQPQLVTLYADLGPGDHIVDWSSAYPGGIDVTWTYPAYPGAVDYTVFDVSGRVTSDQLSLVKPTWALPTTRVVVTANDAAGLPLAAIGMDDVAISDGATIDITGPWEDVAATPLTLAAPPAGYTLNYAYATSIVEDVATWDGVSLGGDPATVPVLPVLDALGACVASVSDADSSQQVINYIAGGVPVTVDLAGRLLAAATPATIDQAARTITWTTAAGGVPVAVAQASLYLDRKDSVVWRLSRRDGVGFALPTLPADLAHLEVTVDDTVYLSGPIRIGASSVEGRHALQTVPYASFNERHLGAAGDWLAFSSASGT